jgi:hypothetical protein
MRAMGDKLDAIPGLQVFPYTADQINPPAALVELPSELTYDATYGRGTDSMKVVVTVAVAKMDARNAHLQLAKYANGSGDHSVKQALEAGSSDAYDDVTVVSAEFGRVRFGGVDYLAGMFSTTVVGSGE